MKSESQFRSARRSDAPLLVELINYAGEGLPLQLWAGMAPAGKDPWAVGLERAERENGSFSWCNATMIMHEGCAAGCLIGYEIEAEPAPVGDDVRGIIRPLCELEALAPDSWYVNVLAVRPPLRGRGLGTKLLELAERRGREAGRAQMSVIVSDANRGARRLYERSGYSATGRRAMIKEGWENPGRDWVLLTKAL
jgi:ribosomal protein S18 acetylase RimI-like enzyme